MPAAPLDVIEFWFGPVPGVQRPEWFRKDDAFDEAIRARFGSTVDEGLRGGLAAWEREGPQGALAQVLVLDQFTRNLFRGSPRAFAGDAIALAAARGIVERGDDARLPPLMRWFAYMPFEHAEDLAAQDEAVRLFTALLVDEPALREALDYAIRHRDVIRRFARFPHRNDVLGRPSTAEEIDFLKQPGSRF